MIKTVIFDIGNVLTDFAWEPFFRKFGFSEEIFERVAKATVKSLEWHEFDRGELTMKEIVAAFIENDPGIEKEIRLVFENVKGLVTKRDYAIPWIQHLKASGLQVLYLSNFAEITKNHCIEALDFIPYTDGGVLSYEIKMVKPNADIYQALIAKYNLNPKECVFVDDTLPNVEAAIKLGMHAIHAVSHEAALEGLAALGVQPY